MGRLKWELEDVNSADCETENLLMQHGNEQLRTWMLVKSSHVFPPYLVFVLSHDRVRARGSWRPVLTQVAPQFVQDPHWLTEASTVKRNSKKKQLF